MTGDEIDPDREGRSGRVEPTADVREAANAMRQLYVALRDEGFTESQTLKIIGGMLAGTQGRDDG